MGRLSLLQRIFPTQGSEPRSPTLQVDSLPAKPQRKSKNTGVGSWALLHGIFPIQESNQGFLYRRRILYQLRYQGRPHHLWSEWCLMLLSRFSRVRICATPDGSPPGFPVPGILQARVLEWVPLPSPNKHTNVPNYVQNWHSNMTYYYHLWSFWNCVQYLENTSLSAVYHLIPVGIFTLWSLFTPCSWPTVSILVSLKVSLQHS